MVEGMAFNLAHACGRAEERTKALDRVSGAESSSCWYAASSIQWEMGCCQHGTSISSRELQLGLLAAAARAETALSR